MIAKQLIILGGGASLKQGVKEGVWDKLNGRFTLGLNYNFNHFDSTAICFVDETFYSENINKLADKQLIIGRASANNTINKLDNTILLPCNNNKYYGRESINKEFYCGQGGLCGTFALTLGIYLLDVGEIFILGYDFGVSSSITDNNNQRITHYYQDELKHRGVGSINFYHTTGKPKEIYKPFECEQRIKIYNVSPNSNISSFEKIDYSRFYKLLDNNVYDQTILRDYIKRRLLCIR